MTPTLVTAEPPLSASPVLVFSFTPSAPSSSPVSIVTRKTFGSPVGAALTTPVPLYPDPVSVTAKLPADSPNTGSLKVTRKGSWWLGALVGFGALDGKAIPVTVGGVVSTL